MAYMESLDDEVQSPLGKPSNSPFGYWGVPPLLSRTQRVKFLFRGEGGE